MTNFRPAILSALILLVLGALCSCIPGKPGNCNLETIEYASVDGQSLLLDIYKPLSDACDTAPLIVYYHGGTWISGSREKIRQRYRNDVVSALVDSGCVVVSVEYRLVGSHGCSMVESLADCHTALQYVRHHGGKFLNGDGRRPIVLWGSSSGAHLALMTAYADTAATESPVRCVIDDFAPTNLVEAFQVLPEWARLRMSSYFFGADAASVQEFDSLARIFSPINNISRQIPVMIFHGTDDDVVLPSHSHALSDSLGDSLSSMVLIQGHGHGLHAMDRAETDMYITELWKFLRGHIGPGDAK